MSFDSGLIIEAGELDSRSFRGSGFGSVGSIHSFKDRLDYSSHAMAVQAIRPLSQEHELHESGAGTSSPSA